MDDGGEDNDDGEENDNDLDNSAETVFDYWNEDPDLEDDDKELSNEQIQRGVEGLKEWAMEAHPEWFEEGFKAGEQAPNPIKEPEEDGLDEEAAPPE